MQSANKIKFKSVGSVRIFEISGHFEGNFAKRGTRAIKTALMTSTDKRHGFFNLERLQSIDHEGLKALSEATQSLEKCALLIKDTAMEEKIKSAHLSDRLCFVHDEFQVVDLLAREFAVSKVFESDEKRAHVRLKTVLPLQFICHLQGGKEVLCFAIISNLSEGGLFAEFIQSSSENEIKARINPYDLKFLEMKLFLKGYGNLQVKGKLIHGSIDEGGIGVEFNGLEEPQNEIIQNWIAKNITNSDDSEGDVES